MSRTSHFVTIATYTTSINEELTLAKMELGRAGIRYFLKDETLVSIDPLLSNAVGGIKLQVLEEEAEEAIEVLQNVRNALPDRWDVPPSEQTDRIYPFILWGIVALVLLYLLVSLFL